MSPQSRTGVRATALALTGAIALIAPSAGAHAASVTPSASSAPSVASALTNAPASSLDVASATPQLMSPSWATTLPTPTLRQAGTGPNQWENCAPTSLVIDLVSIGKVPSGYVSSTNYAQAVINARALMGVPDGAGTSLTKVVAGFKAYGVNASVQSLDATMTAVRTQPGAVAVIFGNQRATGWVGLWAKDLKAGTGVVQHAVALVGYRDSDGAYEIIDPDSAASANVHHWVTEAQLRAYSAYYTYPSNVLAG